MNYIRPLWIAFFIFSVACSGWCGQRVRTGAEVLISSRLELLKGKRIGIICNHTSVLPNGIHLVDTLMRLGVNVTTLFGPEHGIRGSAGAGAMVENQTDPGTGLTVYSLYSKTRKPSAEMVKNVDVVLFDLQDVGSRFYTYAGTMAYAMEAMAEFGKEFVVLDRPNPINGLDVEGPVLDMTLRSFTGLFPIPIRHGLTLGELARMIIGEGWIGDTRVDLTVISMKGWKRSMWYDETGLRWIPPSPNMKTLRTATVYPGMCLFEATNISEGRGTEKPFESIGASGIDPDTLAGHLNALRLKGVRFEPIRFTPRSDSNAAISPKFKDKECGGVFVKVTDRKRFKPVEAGLAMLSQFKKLFPSKFTLREGQMDHFLGDEIARKKLQEGLRASDILAFSHNQRTEYLQARKKYLLYK